MACLACHSQELTVSAAVDDVTLAMLNAGSNVGKDAQYGIANLVGHL